MMLKKENILGYRMLGCEIVNQAIEDYSKAYYTLTYQPKISKRKKHETQKELNHDIEFFKSEFFALCTDADPLDIIKVVQSKSAKGIVYNKTKGWVHARRNKK
jgi:hypothetical protein